MPGKVENDAKVSLPDHTTGNKLSIWDFMYLFIFSIQPRLLEGLFIVRKGCEKLSDSECSLFSRLTVSDPGEGERFQLWVFHMTARCRTFKGIKSRRSCE